MKHIKAKGGDAVEIIPASFINKLYKFCTDDELDDTSDIEGNLYVSNAYETQINYLTDKFKNLKINVSGEYYMTISDDEVRRLLINEYGDGVRVLKSKLGDITKIGEGISSLFQGNTEIVDFDEFQYFTGIVYTPSYQNTASISLAFKGCTNLKYLTIPSGITKMPNWGSLGDMLSDCNLDRLTITNTFKDLSVSAKDIVGLDYLTGECRIVNYNHQKLYLKNVNRVSTITFDNSVSNPVVHIGDKVTELTVWGFWYNKNFQTVIDATTPPETSSGNNFLNKWNRPIFVPDSSVDAYKTATNWTEIASQIFPISKFEEMQN